MQQEAFIQNIVSTIGIGSLNDMQVTALEASGRHNNLMILSATGSGKTLAYLLPLVQSVDASRKGTQAVIIAPSRELALQIDGVIRSMGTGLKVTCTYGGHKREIEENNLVQPPTIIVATPGRLADHIRRGNITTDTVSFVVLDEFDKILELGFLEEVTFILDSLKSVDRRILTSATDVAALPPVLSDHEWEKLHFLQEGATAEKLAVQKLLSPEADKLDTLYRLICHLGNRSMIIFCNHRESVERTSTLLTGKSITNTFYHGAMEQREREVALAKFRNGSVNILVTTDLAARGLDIPNIRYIIHYHLPATEDVYTHRNGRTARMDASGTVILIIGPDEKLPAFIKDEVIDLKIPPASPPPDKPQWTTFFIGAGKKDKVNKVDIVGFLANKGELKKEDIGLIEVKDFFSFVAIRKSKASHTLQNIKAEKIKNRKVKIDIAK